LNGTSAQRRDPVRPGPGAVQDQPRLDGPAIGGHDPAGPPGEPRPRPKIDARRSRVLDQVQHDPLGIDHRGVRRPQRPLDRPHPGLDPARLGLGHELHPDPVGLSPRAELGQPGQIALGPRDHQLAPPADRQAMIGAQSGQRPVSFDREPRLEAVRRVVEARVQDAAVPTGGVAPEAGLLLDQHDPRARVAGGERAGGGDPDDPSPDDQQIGAVHAGSDIAAGDPQSSSGSGRRSARATRPSA
jgi:hypothetical protein